MAEDQTDSTPIEVGPDVPNVYVDGVSFFGSPFTVGLFFTTRRPDGVLTPTVIMRMSPEHAKAMVVVLETAVKHHERSFGVEIQLSESLLEKLRTDDE